ncbi:MAG: tetratricopeptide repeat protein, partial [Candidatus Puniceispirillaceae bacterium]
MADIFDEIEEELKQDRLNSLWAKYGKYLIGFAVAIVALVAGFQGYKSWQKNTIETAADN